MFDHQKYRPFTAMKKANRQWPANTIHTAPSWCAVDLRDGNQALIEPMSVSQKQKIWQLLVDIGFKHIEVGFPSASQTDFDFVRWLIEEDQIPEDVTIQVLVQARDELIERTYQSLVGAKQAIVHVYNSTSPVQRNKVFNLDKQGIIDIAVRGAKKVSTEAQKYPNTKWTFQYSPESFSSTETDFAIDVCNAVINVWQPTTDNKTIINLPATVECAGPNVFADQVETFCEGVNQRENVVISIHTHNDRGCAVAAAEMAILAGADRIEGTLLGNGERTGNMDIVTMAMNLYSQGIDPKLDFSKMDEMIAVCKECTQLPLHPRHPYAGELVFTAFSGSHQDAINKCLARRQGDSLWEVAYLPIDPADIGRSYQEVIRINSQSGKGGVAYVLNRDYGLDLPRWLQVDFSAAVQAMAERSETEVQSKDIYDLFLETYHLSGARLSVGNYQLARDERVDRLTVQISGLEGSPTLSGKGAGVVGAFTDAISSHTGHKIIVVEYSEHTLGSDADAEAICYVQLAIDGSRVCGVGRSTDIVHATMSAILSGLGRYPDAYVTAA